MIQKNARKAKLEHTKVMRGDRTPAENRLCQRLRANRLFGFQFRRQQVSQLHILDFHCRKSALVEGSTKRLLAKEIKI